MDFETFERSATAAWARIPDGYKAGVDGLLVERRAQPHPSRPDVFTLGECVTEDYPSDWGGPDTIRSWVVLYHGSFRRLARTDEHFDWDEEIWETLTHELRHHLESLAHDDALGDVDYAVEENFKRRDGEAFEPLFFRSGEPVGDALYQVEDELFQEHAYRAPASHVEVVFDGRRWRVDWPDVSADIIYVDLPDVAPPPLLFTLVLVRQAGVREVVRSLWSRSAPSVAQVDGVARPLGDWPDGTGAANMRA